MATRRQRGTTPFERLRSVFDERDLLCPECGHEDEDGGWRAETNGKHVRYRHVCPRCDTRRVQRYTLAK